MMGKSGSRPVDMRRLYIFFIIIVPDCGHNNDVLLSISSKIHDICIENEIQGWPKRGFSILLTFV